MAEKKEEVELAPHNVVVNELRRLSKIYRAMETVANSVEQLAGIENHIAELNRERERMLAVNADERQRMAAAAKANESEYNELQRKTDKLKRMSEESVRAAEEKARVMISVAEDKAKQACYEATDKEKIELAGIRKSASSQRSTIKRLAAEEEKLIESISSKQAEFDYIEAKLNDMKEVVAELIK